jgi:hypothetical protein
MPVVWGQVVTARVFLRSDAKSGVSFADKSAELPHPANAPILLEDRGTLSSPLVPKAERYAANLFEFRSDVVETAVDSHERCAQVSVAMLA